MREKWLYDITDSEKALESISKLIDISECDIYFY